MEYLLLSVIILLFGLTVGSFLNVCISRMPKEKSLNGRSQCDSCDAVIKWYDLVPVLSWLLLRGRCRACGASIPVRVMLVELLNGILWVLIFLEFGLSWPALLSAFFVSALIALTFIDVDTLEMPDSLLIVLGVLGVLMLLVPLLPGAVTVLLPGVLTPLPGVGVTWYAHLIGLAACLPLLLGLMLTKGRGMGDGDVYMMAACGLFLGWQGAVFALFAGLIAGCIGGLVPLLIKKKSEAFAFGPYLAFGSVLALFFAPEVMGWYMTISHLG